PAPTWFGRPRPSWALLRHPISRIRAFGATTPPASGTGPLPPSALRHDGTLYVLCFSDEGPDTGPRPVRQEELRAAFDPGHGWNVVAIEPGRIQTSFHADGAPAWLATIRRI